MSDCAGAWAQGNPGMVRLTVNTTAVLGSSKDSHNGSKHNLAQRCVWK
jgi:hypothetical protein